MVWKKDLTPISQKGRVVKHNGGKGTRTHAPHSPHMPSPITRGSPSDRMSNVYGKAPDEGEGPNMGDIASSQEDGSRVGANAGPLPPFNDNDEDD